MLVVVDHLFRFLDGIVLGCVLADALFEGASFDADGGDGEVVMVNLGRRSLHYS